MANSREGLIATISRDIREMQIVKQQDGNGNLRYVIFKANNQSEQDKLYKAIHLG